MTKQELLQAIHFRTVDVPCCGNCKWHKEETWYESSRHICINKLIYKNLNDDMNIEEHNVCDRFERMEETK